MAEMDRELYAATDREGRQLPPNCHRILALLWTNVDRDEAVRYRKEQGRPRRQAPRVALSLLGPIGRLIQLDPDTIKRLVKMLVKAGYVQSDPRDRRLLALLDQQHRDAYLASPAALGSGVKNEFGDDLDHSSGDLADERSGDPDQTIEILRMNDQEIPIVHPDDPLKVPVKRSQLKGPECRSQTRAPHSSDLEKSNLEIALDLVRRSKPPAGAAPLPATPRGVKYLVALLDEGEPVANVEAVLEHAPALVAASLEATRWYRPVMFAGPWAGWCSALAEWRAREAREAAAERAREQRQTSGPSPETQAREALERLVNAIEMPPRLDAFSVSGWEQLDPWNAAARFRPADARRLLDELRAAGELDLERLRGALTQLEVTAQHVQARLVGEVVASTRSAATTPAGDRRLAERSDYARRSQSDLEIAAEHTRLMQRRDQVKRQCEEQLEQERQHEAAARRGSLQ